MDSFTARQQQIIKVLLSNKTTISGNKIAQIMYLSLRTIQNEIVLINKIESEMISSSNRGYSISQSKIEEYAAFPLYFNQKNDDELFILKKLILGNEHFKLDELADELYMSSSTLIIKLKAYQKSLAEHHLKIEHKNGFVSINGSELDKRRFINFMIIQEVDPIFLNIENCASYFEDMDVLRIRDIILDSIRKQNTYIEECYAVNLYINITIALSRIRKNFHVDEMQISEIDFTSSEYLIAKQICVRYASHWAITINESDVHSIALLIMGQIKPQKLQEQNSSFHLASNEFEQQISHILLRTFHHYMLNINYENFLHNFVLHVDALIKRANHCQLVSNSIAKNIKSTCPFIYDVAVFIAKEIEDTFQVRITDEEIAFISIHIGFVIENSTRETDKIRVLLLCNDYHQIGDKLINKLKENYSENIEIVNVISNLKEKNLDSNADLIISTMPLQLLGKKCVVISPFYTTNDDEAINLAIHECMKVQKAKKDQKLLLTYFNDSLFFKNINVQNKEEVITFMGKKIENFGLAQRGFTESVLKREAMSSTCFFDAFAIPHAIDLNAKQTQFCVLIHDKGIHWDEHVIHLILMIAVQQKDRKAFMKIYNGIIKTLWDKKKVEQLIQATTLIEFIEGLKKYDGS